MQRRLALAAGLAPITAAVTTLIGGCAVTAPRPGRDELTRQVKAAENTFAKTMIDRDFNAFLRFVADEAVFLNGGTPLRGKAAIAQFWRRFYSAATPPFTWKPDLVEVLASGTLAQSIGPVAAPSGQVVSRFYSTWQLQADGQWLVVFDDGYDVCLCAAKPG